jgi:hypothetical protein
MNRWQKIAFVFVTTLALLITGGVSLSGSAQPRSKPDENIEGIWQGTLKVSVMELRVVFKISKKPDGTLSATLDSPDQGAKDIPVDKVELKNNNLRLDVKSIQGVFEGEIKENGATIQGQWKQAGMSLPLILKRVDKVPEVRRPQEPKRPYPYDEEEIVYENKSAGIKLAGTLTFPRTKGPFPAVLLITGAGPQDRNETLLGHRPFLVLADYLTRRGVAVLRVDDREVGSSTGNFSEATSKDFASDVLAGVGYLKGRKEINPKQIGLIGHSEGGVIAPMVAVQSPDVAFIVMMAGTGLTGEEILYLQSDMILKAAGATDKIVAFIRETQEREFAVIKKEKNRAIAEKKLREILQWQKQVQEKLSKQEQEWLDSLGDMSELEIKMVLSPWFRQFLTYDPRPTLMKVKCPVLAIIGELDLQVAPKENLCAIEEALKAGGNKHYVVKELPKLNHLFQTAKTGALSEYAKIEETVSPTALELIADWILEQTEKDGG